MTERQQCEFEFAPGVRCMLEEGHDEPYYPYLDYGQSGEYSSILSKGTGHEVQTVAPELPPRSEWTGNERKDTTSRVRVGELLPLSIAPVVVTEPDDEPKPYDLQAALSASWREKYPEVAPFVERMYYELWCNSGKGDQAGWRKLSTYEAWQEISWHQGKLAWAVKTDDENLMRELAADVANGAMMLTDILDQRKLAGES